MPFALLRPDEWDFPLLLHVLGAMLLVGTLIVVLIVLLAAWRMREVSQARALRRFGFLTLLVGALPCYVLMRIGAEWIGSEENLDEVDAEWADIGYVTADLGLLVLVAATVVAWVAARRGAAGGLLSQIAAVLTAVLLAAFLVAVWAMTTKPGA